MDDPTIYVLNKMTEVLKELRVEVTRYNIFEDKQAIATIPSTIKDVDGIILATTVEWFGIGGYMQRFLDMCWFYTDKQVISGKYMFPVVMATAYGERDAEVTLIKAWETLGGISLPGLTAYVENLEEFEQNEEYGKIIEKKTEALYRAIHQKEVGLPTSNLAVKTNLVKTKMIKMTPQEREQLSKFVGDETYVKQQKEDIEELSAMFKQLLKNSDEENYDEDSTDVGSETEERTGEVNPEEIENEEKDMDSLTHAFVKAYQPEPDFSASYAIIISDQDTILHVEATPHRVKCFYAATDEADVILRTTTKVLDAIISGKNSFQKGFMAGEISVKGNFKTIRMLDTLFRF